MREKENESHSLNSEELQELSFTILNTRIIRGLMNVTEFITV